LSHFWFNWLPSTKGSELKPADERKPWQIGKSAQEACCGIPEMIFDRNMNRASLAKTRQRRPRSM
jgi:hypothetical protein